MRSTRSGPWAGRHGARGCCGSQTRRHPGVRQRCVRVGRMSVAPTSGESAHIESLLDLVPRHVRAGEMHARLKSELLVCSFDELCSRLGSRASCAPGDVDEGGTELAHALDARVEVLDSVVCGTRTRQPPCIFMKARAATSTAPAAWRGGERAKKRRWISVSGAAAETIGKVSRTHSLAGRTRTTTMVCLSSLPLRASLRSSLLGTSSKRVWERSC